MRFLKICIYIAAPLFGLFAAGCGPVYVLDNAEVEHGRHGTIEHTTIESKRRVILNRPMLPEPPRLVEIERHRWYSLPYNGYASKGDTECRYLHEIKAVLCFSRRQLNHFDEPIVMHFRYARTDQVHRKHEYRFHDHRPRAYIEGPKRHHFQPYKSYRSGGSVFVK